MLIGHFTERPCQDPSAPWWGRSGRQLTDLEMSNDSYDPVLGSKLYNRYFDEKIFAEEMGFDALALNKHHSTPFSMGGVMNAEAAVLARITKREGRPRSATCCRSGTTRSGWPRSRVWARPAPRADSMLTVRPQVNPIMRAGPTNASPVHPLEQLEQEVYSALRRYAPPQLATQALLASTSHPHRVPSEVCSDVP